MKRGVLYKALLSAVALLAGLSQAYAVDEHFYNSKSGKHFAVDSSLTVQDDKFGTPLWSTIQKNIKATDIITLQLNEDTALFLIGNHTCKVDLEITYLDSAGTADSLTTSLSIRYDTARAKSYNFRSSFKFVGGYSVTARILSVTYDGSITTTFPKVFTLEGDIYVDRVYKFDCSTPPTFNSPSSTYDGTNQRLDINWQPYAGADEYDLEFTSYDDSSSVGKEDKEDTGSSYSDFGFLFNDNATRVTVKGGEYDISLVYNPGYIFYRVRAIHYDTLGNRIEGAWSSVVSSVKIHSFSDQYQWGGHENKLNWQYTAAYAEEGKRKEVTSYFDGTLRNRQSVTLNNTENKAIVGETIYDFQGRPAVTTLPAPIDSGKIIYYNKYNVDPSDSEYNRKDFDSGGCGYSPVGMDSLSLGSPRGSSAYYSSSNPDTSSGFDKYLPDAEGYPFTMTEYTPDNTGRIKRQSIAGKTFRFGSGHETKYYYGKPAQEEIDRLFGNEVGDSSHYLQNMVIDANGQISVSYIDENGRTVATALAGQPPSNVKALPSYYPATTLDINLLNGKPNNPSNSSIFSTYSLLATNAGLYRFSYTLLPGNYMDSSCSSVCTDCLYDIVLKVSDDCGVDTVVYDSNFSYTSAFDTNCGHHNVTDTFDLYLQPGNYNISRLITVDAGAIDYYTARIIKKNTCYKSYSDFLTSAIANTDFGGCNMTCATCLSDLGADTTFLRKYIQELIKAGMTPTRVDTINADTAYNQALAECNLLCEYSSPCTGLYDAMLADVSIGGQYCLDSVSVTGDTIIPMDSTSMLKGDYTSPITPYVDAAGNPSVVWINNMSFSPQQLTVSDFVKDWQPSWAASLIQYHPEYCYYTYCTIDSASNRWDYNFENTDTWSSAFSGGFLAPLGSGPCSCSTTNPDPYFKKGGLGQADSTWMRNRLKYYVHFGASYLNLWEAVALAVNREADTLQGNNITKAISVSDTDFCGGCTGNMNLEWQMFRGIYMSIKGHIQDSLENIYVTTPANNCSEYVNCIGSNSSHCASTPYASKTPRHFSSLNVSQYLPGPNSPNANTELRFADSAITANCDTTCVSYAYYWYHQLDSCGAILHTDSAALIKGLIEVCEAGCGANHPIGTSTTPNSIPDSSGDISFEDVIHRILGASYSDTLCNGTVLSMPPPWYDSTGFAGPMITYYRPTDCQCGNIDTAYNIYHADSLAGETVYKNFGDFLTKYYGDSISEANAWAIKDLCADSCFFAPTPIEMPLWISCCGSAMQPQQITNPYGFKWNTANLTITTLFYGSHSVGFNIGDSGYIGCGNFYDTVNSINALNQFVSWHYGATHITALSNAYPGYGLVSDVGFGVGGKGYVGLGYDTATHVPATDFHSFDPATSTWSTSTSFPDSARFGAFSFVIGDTAYVGCGGDTAWYPFKDKLPNSHGKFYSRFYAYHPGTGTWSRRADFPGSGRTDMAAFSIGNYGYAGCGYGKTTLGNHVNEHNDMWKFDPSTNSWTQVASIPSSTGIVGAVGFSYYDRGYVGQGEYVSNNGIHHDSAQYFNTFWQYNPDSNKWTVLKADSAPVARAYGSVVSIKNKAFFGGGLNYIVNSYNNLSYAKWWDSCHILTLDTNNTVPEKFASPHCCITCTDIDTAMKHFAKAYPSINDSNPYYPNMVTNYLNQYFGFDLTFGDYLVFSTQCDTVQTDILHDGRIIPLTLCNRAENELPPGDTNSCYTYLMMDAQYNAQAEYNDYLDSIQDSVRTKYVEHCMNIDDSFNLNMPFDEYHYTLYYYDQAGNLVKTVPPDGVNPITNPTLLADITQYRKGIGSPVYPVDSMTTRYWYNTLNSPIQQVTPDGDTTHFWYDRLGRLVLSQNAVQKPLLFSYTQYDALGRIIEVGQVSTVPANLPGCFHCVGCTVHYGVYPVLPDTFSRNDAELQNFINTGTKTQVTHTYYDTAQFSTIPLIQQNLRKRIASITYQDVYDNVYTDSDWVHVPKKYDNAIHYSYDIEGNVATILLDVPHDSVVKQRYKRVDYYYDLISGSINELVYQHDSIDQFIHVYEYDADNRITDVLTSHDSIYWEHDAGYEYYDHGPLARVTLGRRQVQGIDYAYTINGWLKAVNSSITNPTYDMGHDGDVHSATNDLVARDAYGYTLNYFNGDYRAIGAANFEATGLPITSLYNGNLAGATYSIKPLRPSTIAYTYGFDQLNRLVSEMAFKGVDTVHNLWAASDSISDFREKVRYDENGNILLYLRHGNSAVGPLAMDSLTFHYTKGRNQLTQVNDAVGASNYSVDVDNETSSRNYRYNGIGQLAKDSAGGLDTITWTIYNKVHSIKKHNGDSIVLFYDPLGNRLEKRLYPHSSTADTTKYVRDGTGNIMAIYDRHKDTVRLTEWDIYGNKRVGAIDTVMRVQKASAGIGSLDSLTTYYLEGQKQYELVNQVGNVLVTVSDKKIAVDTNHDSISDYYNPVILSSQDYYPFGMVQPGRSFSIFGDSAYKFGFNGMMRDNEIYGAGNLYTTLNRELDDRVPRWWSPDPVINPSESPYVSMGDNPVMFSDPLGNVVEYGTKADKRRVTWKRIFNRKFRQQFRALKQSDMTYTFRLKDNSPSLADAKPDYGRKLTTQEYLNGDWKKYNVYYAVDPGASTPPSTTTTPVDNNTGPYKDAVGTGKNSLKGVVFEATYTVKPGAVLEFNTQPIPDKVEIISGGNSYIVKTSDNCLPGFFSTGQFEYYSFSLDALYKSGAIIGNTITIRITGNPKEKTVWYYRLNSPNGGALINYSIPVKNGIVQFKQKKD